MEEGPRSDVSNALEFWKNFNLDDKRLIFDKQCVEMKEAKVASISGRKRLNEATKAFRAKPTSEQLTTIPEILKSYQDEIDQLSRRAKASEAAFFGLYKSLYDGIDPVPIIESLLAAQTQSSSQLFEIERLKSELAQYDMEFQQLKNQDITIRRLEDQIEDFQENLDDKVSEQVARATEEVEAACEARISEVKEHQRSAERRLAAALETTRHAREAADRAQSRLFEVSSAAEGRVGALQVENSMLQETVDRLRSRVAELENEIAANKCGSHTMNAVALGSSTGGVGAKTGRMPSSGSFVGDTECDETTTEKLAALGDLISDLREELVTKEEMLLHERMRCDQSIKEHARRVEMTTAECTRLSQELARRPHKEEVTSLKRQLRVLHNVIFNAELEDDEDGLAEDDDWDEDNTGGEEGTREGSTISTRQAQDGMQKLETMLVARLKALESELAEGRAVIEGLKSSEESSRKRADGLETSLRESKALVAQLEADLEHHLSAAVSSGTYNPSSAAPKGSVSATTANASTSSSELKAGLGSAGGGPGAPDAALLQLLAMDESSRSSGLGEVMGHGKKVNAAGVCAGGGGKVAALGSQTGAGCASGQQQMITILQAQRDRYKERLDNLEAAHQTVQSKLAAADTMRGRLEADNVDLYAKLRHLQNGGVGMRDPESGLSSASLRLQQKYEEALSPYTMFAQLDRQRKLKELSVLEKILLNSTVACVSTRAGRSALGVYLGTMHLLVFCTLYFLAHHHHCSGGHSSDGNM